MSPDSLDHFTELERQTNRYLGLIRRIDAILEGPVKTLISTIGNHVIKTDRPEDSSTKQAAQNHKMKAGETEEAADGRSFPVWVSEDVQPETRDYLFTKSLCFTTLQKISRFERRFVWLDKDYRKILEYLTSDDHSPLVNSLIPETMNFNLCVEHLSSRSFGALNPLTSSQVFYVLLNAGESKAHDGHGFLAFFAMIWPLYRRFPDRQSFGAAIEPWQPKAYVTARCVLPIRLLHEICTQRADILEEIADSMGRIKTLSDSDKPHDRWQFSAELDELTALLSRLGGISIERKALRKCAKVVEEQAEMTSQNSGNKDIYKTVFDAVADAFQKVGKKGTTVLGNANVIIKDIERQIVKPLHKKEIDKRLEAVEDLKTKLKMKFATEYLNSPDHREEYLNDLRDSAKKAYVFCRESLDALLSSCEECEKKMSGADMEVLQKTLKSFADSNRKIALKMDNLVSDATAWCRTVTDREIAYASARNTTDFDPSELVSAIAVAVRWNQMTTTLQVRDAVSKALAGAREDGSWSPGQPFYSPNNAAGIWPVTSDIVWTLTSAIQHQPQVDVADEALFNFIDWLERTRVELKPNFDVGADVDDIGEKSKKAAEILRKTARCAMVGWASDRLRHPKKIHFATTAFSINALFEIRDLVEYRLWQLCEKRFNVLSIRNPLKDISPVDLGAKHKHRLHRRLAQTARNAQGGHYSDAEYSFVLHGPPGSSKTVIAEALSTEMWKASAKWGERTPRLVRITPADFTRLGEDRLDSEARLIFDLISGVRGATILFDEIDDLLRQREGERERPRFMDLVVPAMLNRLADLRKACPRQEICFLFATNYVDNIEPALIRKGRIDRAIPVVYPDYESRRSLVTIFTSKAKKLMELADEVRDEMCRSIASRTPKWPYMTLKAACDYLVKKIEQGSKDGISEAGINEIVNEMINEFASSFTQPDYARESNRWNKRFSRELLDEYLHYELAGPPHLSDFDARDMSLGGKSYSSIKINEQLRLVAKNEERFGLNGNK